MSSRMLGKKERSFVMACVYVIFNSEKPFAVSDIEALVKENNSTGTNTRDLVDAILEQLKEMSHNISYNTVLGMIEKMEEFSFPESSEYIIHFKKQNDKIKIGAKDLLERKVFDVQFLSKFHLVPIGNGSDWKLFLSNLMNPEKIKRAESKTDIDDNMDVVELIIRTICSSVVTVKVEDTLYSTNRIFEEDGKVFVATSTIRKMLEKSNIKIEMRKMRVLLDDYLISSTQVLRINDKTYRFWVFDLNKLGKLHRVKVGEDEENGN